MHLRSASFLSLHSFPALFVPPSCIQGEGELEEMGVPVVAEEGKPLFAPPRRCTVLPVFSILLVLSCFHAGRAQKLVHEEVEALKTIGSRLRKKWDFSVDPCSGTAGWVEYTGSYEIANNVTCQCNTSCHVTSMYAPFALESLFPCSEFVTFGVNNNNAVVEVLTGSNYKKWRQDLEFALGIADIDLALHEPRPIDLNDQSTIEQKDHLAKWKKSNRLSLIAIKRSISEHLLSSLSKSDNAKELLDAIEQRYLVSNNAEIGSLMELTTMTYNNIGGVREYILKMVHIQSKLKGLKIDLPIPSLCHMP